MQKLLTLALALVLCFPLFSCFSDVEGATNVSGLIKSDTTWGLSGSPYQLTGAISVLKGVTLTIEPGVTVNIANYYLRVNGTIQAQGTAENRIHFTGSINTQNYLGQIQFMDCTSWNNQTAKGCILQNIIFDGPCITVTGTGVPVIADSIFYNQVGVIVTATSTEVIVTGNEFRDVCNQGLSIGKSSSATNNLFNKTTTMATAIVAHENAYATNNVILSFYAGITSDSTGAIENNVITNCTHAGISSSSINAKVAHNYVANNHIGIAGSGIIEANTLINNEIGLSIYSSSSSITHNNIVDNRENNLVVTRSDSINAANNWWGTADQQKIGETIKDYNDDNNLGIVTFLPILDRPNTDAPASNALDQTLASINGYSFNLFSYQVRADILTITQIVLIGITICWAVAAVVLVVKRVRRKRA